MAMIERLRIENFRCLRHVDVPLRPLTVLIGENDTGKSSFLDALVLLTEEIHELRPESHWKFDYKNAVELEIGGLSSSAGEQLLLRNPEAMPSGYYQWDDPVRLKTYLPMECFRLPSFGLKLGGHGFPDAVHLPSIGLASDGSNLAAILDVMLRADRKRFFAMVERLCQLVPGVADLNIRTPDAEKGEIELALDNGLRLPADLASNGVKLLLFFLTLAYRPGSPKIVLIEEPEGGIHPRRLGDVMRLLRGLTTGVFGESPVQVILSTHSPYLLDHVDLDRDQVLVFRREPDGSRSVEPVDRERLDIFLDEFQLGEVWFNETEEGLVAKPNLAVAQ